MWNEREAAGFVAELANAAGNGRKIAATIGAWGQASVESVLEWIVSHGSETFEDIEGRAGEIGPVAALREWIAECREYVQIALNEGEIEELDMDSVELARSCREILDCLRWMEEECRG